MCKVQKNTRETYQIEVEGHLDPKWRDWFDSFEITPQDTNVTLLRGAVEDQAALHGLLAKIRDLGLSLLSVNRVKPGISPHWRTITACEFSGLFMKKVNSVLRRSWKNSI